MRIAILLVALFCVIGFSYNVYLVVQTDNIVFDDTETDFGRVLEDVNSAELTALRQGFREKIAEKQSDATQSKNTVMWMGVFASVLLGTSTLISSISAIKSKDQPGQKSLIAVAVLTFVSGVFQTITLKTEERKTEHVEMASKVKDLRNEFMLKYATEENEFERSQLIVFYGDKLTDL